MAKKTNKTSHSNKLEISLERIDAVFNEMKNKRVSVKKIEREKERQKLIEKGDFAKIEDLEARNYFDPQVSDRTIQTYKDMMKGFMKEANKRFGVADIRKIKESQINEMIQERIDQYHAGNTSEAYNLKTLVAAIKSFNLGVEETKIFNKKKKFQVGDPDKIRETLKEQYVFRKSAASKVLRGTPDECLEVIENIKKMGYDTKTREIAYHVSKLSFETGGRISAILKLRAGDISINTRKNAITYYDDKGGKTRTIEVSKDTAEYFRSLINGKKPNQRLFSSTRQENGTFKPISEIRKEVSKIIADAGAHLTRTEMVKIKNAAGEHVWVPVEKKVSAHFFRKGFSMKRTKEYYDKFATKSAIDSFISKKVAEDPKVLRKMNVVRDRINGNRKTPRDLTREEYAIFATSLDLGHYRNDVISAFYTTFKEVQHFYDKK